MEVEVPELRAGPDVGGDPAGQRVGAERQRPQRRQVPERPQRHRSGEVGPGEPQLDDARARAATQDAEPPARGRRGRVPREMRPHRVPEREQGLAVRGEVRRGARDERAPPQRREEEEEGDPAGGGRRAPAALRLDPVWPTSWDDAN